MKLFIFIFLLFGNAYGIENDWSLKGGLGINFQTLNASHYSNDNLFGLSGNTSFGYRFSNFSISCASYISIGHVDNIIFKVDDQVHGYAESTYGSFNLMILFKYYTNQDLFKKYQLYFSLGPGISLQTFWPEESSALEGFTGADEKLSLETTGVFGTIGMEERTLFKEDFGKFLEILWGFNNAIKATLVDIKDSKTTQILKTDKNSANFKNFIILMNFGITFF
jgi:hypothetical protein